MSAVRTTCPYCGVGCGVTALTTERKVAELSGDTMHPANRGRLCSKGSALGETVGLESRLLHPLIGRRRAGWDEALNHAAQRFREIIRRHGPDSVAFYVSGQLLTEDYYVANKLMKGFIGSGNIDTNSRLCMSSAVAGHKRAFGADAVPGCYEDFEIADLVVFVGSNTAWCHPVLYQRLLAARASKGTRIVVIDPRRTPTCEDADLHIPLRAGSDVRLFNALLSHVEGRNALDRNFIAQHTSNFDAALTAAREDDCSIMAVAADCGVEESVIETFFDWFVTTPRTVTAFSQGVNQSSRGVDKCNAIINCHLATGRIGKPGASPFSITGQPNAMGGREVGGLANQLAAHMDFSLPDNIARVEAFWGAHNIARRPGLMAVDLFDAVADGRVRAVWIMATNPAASLPDAAHVKRALAQCEFVVVSDCVADTDTARLAHVTFSAAAWGEKDGTVTNSERCLSRQRPFMPLPGEAKPDWWIITEIARRMGFGAAFQYRQPSEIFTEHAALSGLDNHHTRAFDIGGLSDLTAEDYDDLVPVQWPVSRGSSSGTKRLFANGEFFTISGRAQFVALHPHAPKGKTSAEFPFILNTGRIRDQWHTMTRTGLSARLSSHFPEPFVEIHPEDAERLNLKKGRLARIRSLWGDGVFRVVVTDTQKSGNLFIPIHWTGISAADSVCGTIVNPFVDALSGQPEFKHTAVSIEPLQESWRGFFLTDSAIESPQADYWVRRRITGGLLYEMAGLSEESVMPSLESLAPESLNGGERIEVVNRSRRDYRVARLVDGRLTHCLILTRSGRLPPRGWLSEIFGQAVLSDPDRMTLLSGIPTDGAADQGALVCACFGVGQKRILSTIQAMGLSSVEAVGTALKAGTNCGSCRSEIRALLQSATAECPA